jgi:hypothetical protein
VKEVTEMLENRGRAHAAIPFHASFDWDEIREKMKKTCTSEEIATAVLAGATLVNCGALVYSLILAFQNYTIIGY